MADSTFWRFVTARQDDEHKPGAGRAWALKTIATVCLKEIEPFGQFACAGSYAEVVTPGVVYRGGQVRIECVRPR